MTTLNNSRENILARIRKATLQPSTVSASPSEETPRSYIYSGTRSTAEAQTLLAERLREYDATVVECESEQLCASIAEVLRASGRTSLVAPPDLPPEWMVSGFHWRVDEGLTYQEVEQTQGVLTGAFAAIADSGTIVLHHQEREGRRLLTLLPDWHLCILKTSQVVETLPEYFAMVSSPPPLVTWISGPSATADIEMTRIKGVHGPRFLNVILVRD